MSYPIFVLEGPDCGGKSTLAGVLKAKTGAKIIHSTYRFKGKMMAYHLAQFRKALRLAQDQPVILDRFWPSEIAYGNTYRSGPEEGYDYEVLADLTRQYFVSTTFCMPNRWEEYWKWLQNHYVAEEEMFALDEARYHRLWMTYRELMYNNWHLYDRDLIQHYNVCIESQENRCNGFANYLVSRFKQSVRIMKPEDKERMKWLSKNWKRVGRLPTPSTSTISQELLDLERQATLASSSTSGLITSDKMYQEKLL